MKHANDNEFYLVLAMEYGTLSRTANSPTMSTAATRKHADTISIKGILRFKITVEFVESESISTSSLLSSVGK